MKFFFKQDLAPILLIGVILGTFIVGSVIFWGSTQSVFAKGIGINGNIEPPAPEPEPEPPAPEPPAPEPEPPAPEPPGPVPEPQPPGPGTGPAPGEPGSFENPFCCVDSCIGICETNPDGKLVTQDPSTNEWFIVKPIPERDGDGNGGPPPSPSPLPSPTPTSPPPTPTFTPPPSPTLTFTANPASIVRGETSRLSWSSNADSCIADCISGDCVEWDANPAIGLGTYTPTSGSQAVSPDVTATYRLSCFTTAGGFAQADQTISVGQIKWREIIPRLPGLLFSKQNFAGK